MSGKLKELIVIIVRTKMFVLNNLIWLKLTNQCYALA